jgi:hypothetical protein
VANPGRHVAAGSSILLRRSVRSALVPPGVGLLASCDAGRVAAGRAGSFNSGKNNRDSVARPGPDAGGMTGPGLRARNVHVR